MMTTEKALWHNRCTSLTNANGCLAKEKLGMKWRWRFASRYFLPRKKSKSQNQAPASLILITIRLDTVLIINSHNTNIIMAPRERSDEYKAKQAAARSAKRAKAATLKTFVRQRAAERKRLSRANIRARAEAATPTVTTPSLPFTTVPSTPLFSFTPVPSTPVPSTPVPSTSKDYRAAPISTAAVAPETAQNVPMTPEQQFYLAAAEK